MRKRFLVLGFLLSVVLFAQENTSDELLRQKIESHAENLNSEDVDFSAIEEQLNYYRTHPLNINYTNHDELKSLIILNDIQINNLFEHIRKNGELIDVNELQSVSGFDVQTIRGLLPFITVVSNQNKKQTLSNLLTNGNSQLDTRWQRVIEQQQGYKNSTGANYLGSPDKLLMRYRYNSSSKLLFGFTGEKDPGEQFLTGTQKHGFDFYSGYVMLNNRGVLKALIVGDYQLSIGQGLISWTGLSFSKTVDVMNINKSNIVFRPHTSVEENLFMRGTAATFKFNKIEFTAFASRNAFDGNVVDTTTNGETTGISSLQQTGYHTTLKEDADKHSVLITNAGGDISYKSRYVNFGAAYMHTSLSANVISSAQLYNQFSQMSKETDHLGVHYNFLFRNTNFFGEAARVSHNGYAHVTGMLVALDKKLSTSLLYRNYSKNYYSLYANGFADNSSTNNEHGVYVGMQLKLIEKITINSYYDLFTFPWLKYQVNSPSRGTENFIQMNFNPTKKFEIYFRYRRKNKQMNTYNTAQIDYLVPVTQDNFRLHASYSVNKWLRLSNRVEYVLYDRPDATRKIGFLMYQDVAVKILKKKCSVMLRYTLFDADDYYSRVYAYENDLPYSFSIPSFYNQGARYYFMINYDVTKNISLWLRYSQTNYSNVNVVSPGTLNEIQGNTKSEVKAQAQIRF